MPDTPRTPSDAPMLSLSDAAVRLGISPDAARKRLERGTLQGEKRDGRWYVSMDPDATASTEQDAKPDGIRQGHDATRTPPDAAADVAPLASLIEKLARENAELSAAAALWQERARFLGERLAALESGAIQTPAGPKSDESGSLAQDQILTPLRDDAPEMTDNTLSQPNAAPRPGAASHATGWRAWWRRITSG